MSTDERLEELEKKTEAMSGGLSYANDQIDILKEENEKLREENEQLRRRIADIEAIIEPNPGSKEYRQMSKDERVLKVRRTLARRAKKNGGKASMDYNDISAVFDEEPSNGYCFKLMKAAKKAQGYEYEKRTDGNDRVKVELAAVNDERVLHAVNKPTTQTTPA